jgi:thiamine biosynthesis protein ThiS
MKQSLEGSQLLQNIEITVNGSKSAIPKGQTVEGMLAHLGIRPDRVAVELNKQIVSKRDWASTVVPGNSFIEVVEFVGGG